MKWILLALLAVAAAATDDSSLKKFRVANFQFTAKLYKGSLTASRPSITSFFFQELIKTDSEPVLVCPLSAQLILSLLHAGAKGPTAEQIATGLSLPNDNALIASMTKDVMSTLKSESYYTINTANKIFVSKGFEIKKGFAKAAVETFKAGVESVDFGHKVEAARTINGWVEAETNHTIHDIISADDIEDTLRLVLVNTLYMQATWMNFFLEDTTKKKNFYLNKDATVQVDMMKNSEAYEYFECGDLNAKFLKMEYRAPDLSMVVVLPNDKDGLAALEDRIGDVLNHSKYTSYTVTVELPKFEMDTTIKLNPILEALGIEEAFKTSADLTGISDKTHLYVSSAVQKNHIEVNEKGTVASSATAIHVSADSAYIEFERKEFVADHPFIYYIQSSKSGVLFIGKYIGK